MATKITVTLEDDLNGGPADETVRFAGDGTGYEIDLNANNAAAFRRQLAPTSTTPAGRAQDSGWGGLRPAGHAAQTSGPGPKTTASRSAAAGASPPTWPSSTTPPPRDREAGLTYHRPASIPARPLTRRPVSGARLGRPRGRMAM